AVMKTRPGARARPEALVAIGLAAGLKPEARITEMDTPLGAAVGNALEVIESIDVLKGKGPRDLIDVSLDLTARMLVLGKVARDRADAERQAQAAIDSGAGLERMRKIIEAQGGDPRVIDDYSRLPSVGDLHFVA